MLHIEAGFLGIALPLQDRPVKGLILLLNQFIEQRILLILHVSIDLRPIFRQQGLDGCGK